MNGFPRSDLYTNAERSGDIFPVTEINLGFSDDFNEGNVELEAEEIRGQNNLRMICIL